MEIPHQDGQGGTEQLNDKSSLKRNRKRHPSTRMNSEVLTTTSAHPHLQNRFRIAQLFPLLDEGPKEDEIGHFLPIFNFQKRRQSGI